ncbi:MAG: hypothetical protein KatS3mg034_0595 [Vicingaceae bacterium]|nr:MAG: hypothetical protein KatS3mg034_0595 [Vicingaceae bacterium]
MKTSLNFLFILFIAVLMQCNQPAKGQISWQPFTPQNLQNAAKQNKPLILHLAANWCHWCHVMEEKTYQNPQVVSYIQKNFIACREDHDQRPDLANKYREYGWPATIIFDPQGNEIFKQAGYIEANEFLEILKKIKSGQIKYKPSASSFTTNDTILRSKFQILTQGILEQIDTIKGGFDFFQKSVNYQMFEYAFNHQKQAVFKKWLNITMQNSLHLLDTVWGGYYQYSTYGEWTNPHYEKLLSIQARYVKMNLWYFYVSDDSALFHAAIKTYQYCKRFLKQPDALYANAQDADLIPGKKAHDYFRLPDKARLKKGIPHIDTNTYTANNARWAESIIWLYAFTGDSTYLNEALEIAQILIKKRQRPDGFYNHGSDNDLTPALDVQLAIANLLLNLSQITGNNQYVNQLAALLSKIKNKFYDGQCLLSFLPLKNYISPGCILEENIEAARLFNIYGHMSGNMEFIEFAKKLQQYLMSTFVKVDEFKEPSLLTLQEELNKEPYHALLLLKQNTSENLSLPLWQIPSFYLIKKTAVSKQQLNENQKEYWEFFDSNTYLFCTNSFCSPPIYDPSQLKNFFYDKLLR